MASVITEGDRIVVREAVRRYPTLALFYGEGLFDLEFSSSAAILTDAATGAKVRLLSARSRDGR